MKETVSTYELAHLVQIEITRYPRSRYKKVQLIVGGEAQDISTSGLLKMVRELDEVKQALRI